MEFMNIPSTQPQETPVSPSVAPAIPSAALSTVWAAPVTPTDKREIRARRGRASLIFTVPVALLVVAMFFNGLFSMPDGGFSKDSLYGMVLVLVLIGVWKLLVGIIDSHTPKPMMLDYARVNEVYEQGVMSTGALDRVVIPFDEVTSFVETRNWIAIFSKDGEIVWGAADLTPEATQTLFAALATHLPQTVFTRKASLIPQKPFETAAPTAFPFDPPLETLPARFSAKGAIARGYAAMLKRGAPLFFLMSMVLANVLCDSLNIVDIAAVVRTSTEHFATQTDLATVFTSLFIRFWLMVGGSLVCAGLGFLLVAWEQTTATRAQNRNGVCIHLLADGIRVQDGANFTVIPQGGFHATRDKNGTVCIPVGNRLLTVSYPDFSRSSRARDIFKL